MKIGLSYQFQDYLASIGADIVSLLERAGLAHTLRGEEMTLNSLEYYQLLQVFDEVLEESHIRQLSQISHIQLFVPAFFAALSSSNGLEALERFSRFKNLIGPIDVEVLISENTVSVSYNFTHRTMALPKFAILNEQLLVLSLLRAGTAQEMTPLLVESPFTYEEATIEVFGIAPQYHTVNRLVFDKADLTIPFLTQNNIMWQFLEPELNKQLAHQQIETCFSGYVQKALYRAIPSGHFSIDEVAVSLGVSVRSLQRYLKVEGTSFQKEIQAVQKAMALSYLKMSLPTAEIASLVGFSEVNAFSRAFKRWTGMTLSAYKRNHN